LYLTITSAVVNTNEYVAAMSKSAREYIRT
jgi:hypothetical protein